MSDWPPSNESLSLPPNLTPLAAPFCERRQAVIIALRGPQ